MCFTSSLLQPRLRCAIGLLGALLAEMHLSGAELDWGRGDTPRVCVASLFPSVVDKNCFTCCLWACWMWYLVGFSRWVCTYSKVKTKVDQWSRKDISDISCSTHWYVFVHAVVLRKYIYRDPLNVWQQKLLFDLKNNKTQKRLNCTEQWRDANRGAHLCSKQSAVCKNHYKHESPTARDCLALHLMSPMRRGSVVVAGYYDDWITRIYSNIAAGARGARVQSPKREKNLC